MMRESKKKRSCVKNGERILHLMTRYFKRPRGLNLTNLDIQGGAEETHVFQMASTRQGWG